MATPSFHAAVRSSRDAVLVDLDVQPGARADAFPAGFDPWRRRIGIQVQAPAQDGRANVAVCALVAAWFDVPARAVQIVQGPTSGWKTVRIEGLTMAAAHAALETVLA